MNLPVFKDQSYGVIPLVKTLEGIKILEIQHNAGHWGLPKGHPEGNEIPTETALRELKEETGIEDFEIIDGISFSQEYSFIKNDTLYEKTVTYFPGYLKDDFKINLQEIEVKDYKLIHYKELLNQDVPDDTKKMLTEIVEFIDNLK